MAWRSRRHHLDRRAPREELLAVASRIGGLHAQLMSSAELTLWARVEGLKAEDVASALWQQRTLFKTWAMRGTRHLLPTSEYGLWREGSAPVTREITRAGGGRNHRPRWADTKSTPEDGRYEEAERLAEFVGGRLDLGWVA